MKLRYIYGPLFAVVIIFLWWFFKQMPETEQQKTVARVEDFIDQGLQKAKDVRAVTKSAEGQQQKILQKKHEQQVAKALDPRIVKIWQEVDQLSLFDTQDLAPFRQQLLAFAKENPQGFEQFIVEQTQKVESHKLETTLFFAETFIKSSPAPGEAISGILNLESPVAEKKGAESSKTDLLKAYALESLFERHNKGSVFSKNPLPVVEVDLVRLAKNSQNLNLVREALLLLRDYYNYSKEQIKILVYARPARDSYAFEDIIQ